MPIEYGCLFCKTGREEIVLQRMSQLFPTIEAISPVKHRYYRHNGVADLEKVKLFPGYIFFKSNSKNFDIALVKTITDVIKPLLSNDNECWQISGTDRELIEELFSYNGEIGLSKAYYDTGNRIRIESGFLKKYEGHIIGINHRAKTAHVKAIINGKVFDLWLGFEEIRIFD